VAPVLLEVLPSATTPATSFAAELLTNRSYPDEFLHLKEYSHMSKKSKFLEFLSEPQLLALARFVIAYAVLRKSKRWREAFVECAQRADFAPYSTSDDFRLLQQIYAQQGIAYVATLVTRDVLRRADRISAPQQNPAAEFALQEPNHPEMYKPRIGTP
jgi:hypothetical protein